MEGGGVVIWAVWVLLVGLLVGVAVISGWILCISSGDVVHFVA